MSNPMYNQWLETVQKVKTLNGKLLETIEFEEGFEGGLTFVFSDPNTGIRGIMILGYTEIGEWIYHLDFADSFEYSYNLDKINVVRLKYGFDEIVKPVEETGDEEW